MKIEPITFNSINKVLTSSEITDQQKIDFLKSNKVEISKMVEAKISSKEFSFLMQNRPLVKFRPLKNSFTKRGDKILLAQALNINPKSLDSYITETVSCVDNIISLPCETREKLKTYIYRHGSKNQVVNMLEYELSDVKNILTTLYKTLNYNTGGMADYYVRPIHRMDNSTLYRTYKTINSKLETANELGIITDKQKEDTAEWSLYRIYQIQNNSKLINAIKIYNQLK